MRLRLVLTSALTFVILVASPASALVIRYNYETFQRGDRTFFSYDERGLDGCANCLPECSDTTLRGHDVGSYVLHEEAGWFSGFHDREVVRNPLTGDKLTIVDSSRAGYFYDRENGTQFRFSGLNYLILYHGAVVASAGHGTFDFVDGDVATPHLAHAFYTVPALIDQLLCPYDHTEESDLLA